MIVAIGLDVDDTFAHFVKQAVALGIDISVVNLRAAVDGAWRFDLPPRHPATLRHADLTIELKPEDDYYCRLIDLSSHAADTAQARRWQALLNGLRMWLDAVPGRVVNRPGGGWNNSSKPLHESALGKLGFQVPESVTSCDAETLRRFAAEAPSVSKAICGVRADTELATEKDFDDFDPASGPVHLQRLVKGADARIHVVGDEAVAQRTSTDAVDYRRGGGMENLETFEIPESLKQKLIAGTSAMGLAFAGWDFKIDDDGIYWCLEANPMPGYGPYDVRAEGSISRAILRYIGAGVSEG
jgi:hypothetical protein